MNTNVDDYIAVASYNTSFASDLGQAMGSEGNFLSSQAADGKAMPGTVVGRTYFINAINQVEDFFTQYGKNAVIGLQEINWVNHTEKQIKYKIHQTNQGYMYTKDDIKQKEKDQEKKYTGSLYIYSRLQEIDEDIAVCVAGVYATEHAKPSLIIAFNKVKFGNPITMEIMEITTPGEGDEEAGIHDSQKTGRPVFFVITDQGYLFINLHAPNQDMIHKYVYKRLNKIFNDIIQKHGNIDENRIFIMGDFNDPYNYFKKLELNGAIMTHTSEFCPEYIKKKSCCYNLNSSGKEARKQTLSSKMHDAFDRPEDIIVIDPGSERRAGPSFLTTDEGSYQTMGDEGSIEYYGFTGDYVFGRRPKTNLDIYKGPGPDADRPPIFKSYGEEISTRSDHEMVFCLYHAPPTLPVGGRRQTKRRRSRKKIYIKIKNKQKKENVEKKQRLTKKRKPRKRKQTKR